MIFFNKNIKNLFNIIIFLVSKKIIQLFLIKYIIIELNLIENM